MRFPRSAGLWFSIIILVATAGLAAPDTPDLADASDSGASNSDNLTNDLTPTFSGGGAVADDTVELFADGTIPTSLGTTTADGSGNWSLTTADITGLGLTDGSYDIFARDSSGDSSSLTVDFDTAAPSAPSVPDLDAASDTGSSNTDNITSDTTPNFTGTAEAGSSVAIISSVDGQVGTGAASGGTYDVGTGLTTAGDHSITATATDAAGNTSPPSAGLSVTLDTSVPAAPSAPDLAAADDSGSSDTDNITNVTTPTFSGTGAVAGELVRLYAAGTTLLGSTTADGTGGFSITSIALTDATYSITAVAVNGVGTESPPSPALSVTIDTTAPTPSVPDLAAASDTGSSTTDNLTTDDTPQFTGTGAENGSAVELVVDSVSLETGTAGGSGNYDFTVSAGNALSLGPHQVSVTSTDLAGNTGTSGELTITIGIDLSVVLVGFPAAAVPGTAIEYQVEVSKSGPGTVTEIELAGAVADGLLGPVVTTDAGFLLPGAPSPQWRDLALTDGSTVTATVRGLVDPGLTGTLDLSVSTDAAATVDVNTGNDTASDSATLTPVADLAITKSNGVTAVSPGDAFTWSIEVTNLGPSDVTGAALTDNLPEAFLFPLRTEGACGPAPVLDYLELDGDTNLNSSAALAMSPDGAHVYAVGSGINSVVAFNREADGGLALLQSQSGLSGLTGGSDAVVSPDGRHVYVTGSTDDDVVVFTRDAAFMSGTYGELSAPVSSIGGIDGALGLAVSPDGRNLYVAASAANSVVVLDRNPATGALTLVQTLTDGAVGNLDGVRAAAVSPDGLRVFVVSEIDNSILAFDRDPADGTLTYVAYTAGMSSPRSLAVSPDGSHVYVASSGDDLVYGFVASDLTPIAFDTAATVLVADTVRVSSDGSRVLATGRSAAGSVTTFSRDATTGTLETVAVFSSQDEGGTDTFDGLRLASGLVLAPDGRAAHVGGVSFAAASAVTSLVVRPDAGCTGDTPTIVELGPDVDVDETIDVEAGGRVVVSISARVIEAPPADELSNTAYVVAPAGVTDPLPASQPTPPYVCANNPATDNNCALDLDAVDLIADISVTKTASPTIVPGDQTVPLVYEIVVRNIGPQPTTPTPLLDIALTDTLPTQFFSSYEWYCQAAGGAVCPAGTGSSSSPVVNTDIGTRTFDLSAAPTARLTFRVTARVRADAASLTGDLVDCPDGGPAASCIANTASVTLDAAGRYGDPTIGNDAAEAFTRIVPTADLAVVKDGRFLPVDPLSLRELAFTPYYGTPKIGAALYNFDRPGFGTIAEVRPGLLVLSNVTGTFETGDFIYSPVSADPLAFYFLGFADGPDQPSTGGTARVLYTIVVTNNGPSDVVDAVVQDTFPAGIVKDPGPPSTLTWSCDPLSACTPPGSGDGDILGLQVDLAAGESVTISAEGELDADPPPVLTNEVSVEPPIGTVDPNASNDRFTNQLVLVAEGDLAVTKSDGTLVAVPGEEITYAITVSNNGPEDLFGVTVLDPVPPQILDASWTCSAEPPISGALRFLDAVGQSGIIGAGEVALSPDDVHLYAAMGDGDALVVLTRVLTEGVDFGNLDPTPIQVLEDGVSGLNGLSGATSVVVSPDGKHVYVAGHGDGAVLVFARDRNAASADFGTLSLIQALQGPAANAANAIAGATTVAGLDGVRALAIDPQGESVYAAGSTGDKTLVVFSRNDVSGQLVAVESFANDDPAGAGGPTDVLDGMADLEVSPDGGHLYVAAATDGAVAVFSRDAIGRLTPESFIQDGVTPGVEKLAGVSSIAVSPDGAHAYTASADDDAVSFFSRDSATGALGHQADLDEVSLGSNLLDGVRSVVVAPAGPPLAPDGQHVYAAVENGNAIAVFRRSTVTGGLTFDGTVANGDPVPGSEVAVVNGLGGVRGVAISKDGQTVYGFGAQFGTIAAFARQGSPPSFSFVDAVFDGDIQGSETVRGLGSATSVVTSPIVGTHVYATGLADDSVAIFERNVDPADPDFGRLTFLEVLQDDDSSNALPGATLVDGLLGASKVAVSPDGLFVYVTSRDESALVVFRRGNDPFDQTNFGRLTRLAVFQDDDAFASDPVLGAVEVDGLFGALGLAVSNQYIYAAGPFDAGIAIFARRSGGVHEFVGAKLNGPADAGAGTEAVEGLQGVADLAITPNNLYAVGSFEDSLVAFARDPSTGALTFLDVWRDGQNGVEGLDRPLGIAISGDREHVYVASSFDNAIAVFGRDTFQGAPPADPNPNFGSLDFLQVLRDGDPIFAGGEIVGTVDGLGGARGVAVSGDGSRVYVAAEFEGALAVFSRNEDPTNLNFGTLSFIEARKDGIEGVNGLDQAYAVAVSPGDRHIYLAGLGDSAIAFFFRNRSSSCSASGTGSIRDAIDIAAGGTVTYTVSGVIDPSATGTLTNAAFVLPCSLDPATGLCVTTNASDPIGGTDPDTGSPATGPYECPEDGSDNNCSVDSDTLDPSGDLRLAKTNSRTTVVPGEEITYTVVVDNDGPSNATGVRVLDDLSGLFELDGDGQPIADWTCRAVPTGRLDFTEVVADGALGLASLASPSGVAVSRDGRHLYATSLTDDAVTVFERDLLDGSLTPLQRFTGADVAALDGPSAVAVSPDDRWVYVTGQVADALIVFERVTDAGDPAYGTLTEADVATAGLDQPVAVAVNPVEPYLYVASANGDALVVFEQLPGGDLVFVEIEANGEDDDPETPGKTISGLGGARGVAVSPDGRNVYVTGASDGAVAWFTSLAGGVLSWEDERNAALIPELAGASAVVVAPDPDGPGGVDGGDHVYVVSETESSVVVFTRNPATGDLALRQTLVDDEDGVAGLGGARAIALSADGVNVYVTGRVDSSLAVFARDYDPASSAFGRLGFVELKRDGFGGVDGLRGAVDVAVAGDGRGVYVAGQGDAEIAVFRRAADTQCGNTSGTGSLDVYVDVAAGARIIFEITGTVRPGLAGELAGGRLTNTASVEAPPGVDPDPDDNSDSDSDDLRPRADVEITKTDSLITVDGLDGVAAVAASADGRSIYAVGREDSALAAFAHDGSGGLAFLESFKDNLDGVDGLNGAADVIVSGDGLNVYAAGGEDNAIVIFQRDDATGRLSLLATAINNQGGVIGILGVSGLALSPDGSQLFAVGTSENSLAVFNREDDPESASVGALVLNQVVANGDTQDSETVEGLGGARAVAVAADGETVYVAGTAESAIAVFELDSVSELLSFKQVVRQGDTLGGAAVDGLSRVRDLVVVGNRLYAVGETSGTVVVLERDAGTGLLTGIAQVVRDGDEHASATVRGLAGASAIVASGDGDRLYVAGSGDSAVAVFERLTDGSLEFLTAVGNDDPPEVEGLGGVGSLALSDGHLFAGGRLDDSLVSFERTLALPELAFVEAVTDGGGGAAPGDPITYVITVTNHGPSQVDDDFGAGGGARVVDSLPVEITGISWTCTNLNPGLTPPSFSVCGSPSGTGDIDLRLGLPPGVTVEIEATGTIRPDAAGVLVNTATVAVPTGVLDPDQTNNSATDGDTGLGAAADLGVTKISCVRGDGQLMGQDDRAVCEAADTGELIPGAEAAYWIRVANAGPSDVARVAVSDPFPDAVTDVEWSCFADPIPGLLGVVEIERDGEDGVEALSGASFVVVSPDGRHVYAAGTGDDAIAVFRRSAGPGQLDLINEIFDGDDQGSAEEPLVVDGLQGVRAMALSPAGGHLYASSPVSDSIAIFERDATSGELSYAGLVQDGVGGVDGLGGVRDLVVSGNGAHLYAIGGLDDAVAVFDRSGASGELTFVEVVRQGDVHGTATVDGLSAPADLVLSADGRHLYVAGSGSDGIAVFECDAATGTLDYLGSVAEGDASAEGPVTGLVGVRAIALTFSGRDLYAAADGSAAVTHLRRDTTTGELEFMGSQPVLGGAGTPTAVEVAAGDLEVYVAVNGVSDGIVVMSRDTTSGDLREVGAALDGEMGVDGLAGASSIALSPEAKHLYAAGPVDDAVAVFDRLTGSRCTVEGSGDIRDLASIIDGGSVTYLAVGRIDSGALGTLVNTARADGASSARDPNPDDNLDTAEDELVPFADLAVEKVRLVPDVVPGLGVDYRVTVRNDGPSDVAGVTVTDNPPLFGVGTTAGFVADSLQWLCRADTSLQFLQALRQGDTVGEAIDGLDEVVAVALSHDGRHIYAASRNPGAVAFFERQHQSGGADFGQLTFLGSLANGDPSDGTVVAGLAGASSVVVSPDDAHVYVSGRIDDSVVVFRRILDPEDPDFGTLVYEGAVRNGEGGVFGLDGASSLALAPDGSTLYVTGEEADAVAVFSRVTNADADEFGGLTWIERQKDGFGELPLGVLNGASKVAVSPDGAHVLVASSLADSIAVFERGFDGRLAKLQILKDDGASTPVPGATISNGLDHPSGLAFGPGGQHLYVTGLADDSLTVFERDADADSESFGRLAAVQIFADGLAGATTLDGASSVTVSPDGAVVVVASRNDDALKVFRRDTVNGGPGFGRLTQLQTIADGDETVQSGSPAVVDGLDGTIFAVFSDDGEHLYAASAIGSAIAVLGRSPISGCTSSGEGAIVDTVVLTAGSSVTYTISGLLHPSARGDLINVASVVGPPDVPEPDGGDPDNNQDSDDGEPSILTPVSQLSIVKTNNQLTSVKGLETTYTITVANAGPSDSIGAAVTDIFTLGTGGYVDGSIEWTCAATGGACTAAGSGDIADVIALAAGGSLKYTVTATVHPRASGDISNTASVTSEPPPASDPNLADNSSTDVDGVVTITDLAVTKSDGTDVAARGGTLTYVVTVTNLGPSFASQVDVTDVFPAELVDTSWSCAAGSGAVCGGGGVAVGIDDRADLPPGTSVVYTVVGTLDQTASGVLSNTAAVAPSVADTDPNLSNNQATDVDQVVTLSDLAITKTNNVDQVFTGSEVTWIITATNYGPSDTTGVRVTDTFPAAILDPEWSCEAEAPGSCGLGGALAAIDDSADLPAGTSVVYTVSGTVDPAATGDLVNTAAVAPAAAGEDPDLSDNEATDSDPIVDDAIFSDGFELGDTSAWSDEQSKSFELAIENEPVELWNAAAIESGADRLRARFRFDTMDTEMDEGAAHTIAAGIDRHGLALFTLELGFLAGGYELRATAADDRAAVASDWHALSAGSHWIEVLWWSAGDDGGGGFRMWIDGRPAAELAGLDIAARIHGLVLGVLDGRDASSRGNHRYEHFRWSRGAELPPLRQPEHGREGPR